MAKAPVVVPIGNLPKGAAASDSAEVDAATLKVAKMMDVSEADLKTYGD
jgi:hypothetical protein